MLFYQLFDPKATMEGCAIIPAFQEKKKRPSLSFPILQTIEDIHLSDSFVHTNKSKGPIVY